MRTLRRPLACFILASFILSLLVFPTRTQAQQAVPTINIHFLTNPMGDATTANLSEGEDRHVNFTLSTVLAFPLNVTYTTVAESATGGSDFVVLTGTLTIPAFASESGYLLIDTINESALEGAESFRFRIVSTSFATIRGVDSIRVNIEANDEITFRNQPGLPSNYPTTDESVGTVRVWVYKIGYEYPPATVRYAVTGGTATAGADFAPITGTLSFDNGWYWRAIDIPIYEDGLKEGNETLVVTLSNPTNAELGAERSYVVTILANDELSFSTLQATVNESAGTVQVPVVLNAPSAQEVRVSYATSPGTAQSGSDYTHAAGQLIFAPGDTVEYVTVPLTVNGSGEINEYFFSSLSAPINAQLSKTASETTITIIDDGCPPTIC